MPTDDSTAPPPPLRIGLPSRLGEMLIRQGLVTSEDVQAALAEQAAGSEWRLGRLLVRRGALDDRTLVQAIAHQFHVPVVDLRVEPPTREALGRLARGAACQLQALPLRLDADALVVAVADPPVRELRVAVERCTGLPVRLVLAAADELTAALDHWYSEDVDVSDAAMGTAVPEEHDGNDRPAAGAEPEPAAAEPAPVDEPSDLQIVVWLLTEAIHHDATAVHLDHSAEGLRIRYRVDGALVPGPSLPDASGTLVCHRLLAAAQLDPADDGLHQGGFDTVVDGKSLTCRVTALATGSGTHVVVRTEAAARPGRLEDLRIAAADAAAVRAILSEGHGVVVVAASGPVAADVCRILVDETGPDDHVVVSTLPDGNVPRRGAVVVDATREIGPEQIVPTARALGADVLVTGADEPGVRRAAFEAAADLLVVLHTSGEDPSEVVAEIVDEVGRFLVAGMLRLVLVAGTDPADPGVDVHLVTEDVCRAILDLPRH